MSNYYAITIRASFGLLADSPEEAEALARKLAPTDDLPSGVVASYEADLTRNQLPIFKRCAVNYEP